MSADGDLPNGYRVHAEFTQGFPVEFVLTDPDGMEAGRFESATAAVRGANL